MDRNFALCPPLSVFFFLSFPLPAQLSLCGSFDGSERGGKERKRGAKRSRREAWKSHITWPCSRFLPPPPRGGKTFVSAGKGEEGIFSLPFRISGGREASFLRSRLPSGPRLFSPSSYHRKPMKQARGGGDAQAEEAIHPSK